MINIIALRKAADECEWNDEMQLIVLSDYISNVEPNTFVAATIAYVKAVDLPLDTMLEFWCKVLDDAGVVNLETALAPLVEISRIPKPALPVDVSVTTVTDPKTKEITLITNIPHKVMMKMLEYLNLSAPVADEHIGAVLQRWTKPLPNELMAYVDVTNSKPRPSLDAYAVNKDGRAIGSAPPCGIFDINIVKERGIIISSFEPNTGKIILRFDD